MNEVMVDLNVETDVAVMVSVTSSVTVTVSGVGDGDGDASAVASSVDSDVGSRRESAGLDVTIPVSHSEMVDKSVNIAVVTTVSGSGLEVTSSLTVVVLVTVAVET